MKKFIVTLTAIFSVALLSGQQSIAYALQKESAVNGFLLIGINLQTGTKTCLSTISDVHSVESSFSGVYAKEGIFYFMGHDDDDGETYLYSVDLNTGNVIANPEIEQSSSNGYLKELQVDPNTGVLYALERKTIFNPNPLALVSIDPATGSKTTISNLPSMEGVQLGFSAFNWQAAQYHYMGMDTSMVWRLYSVDINTGAILSDPVIEQDPVNGYLNELAIDYFTGELYALHRTTGENPVVSLVSIDPATGEKSVIATVPEVYIIQNSFSAINSLDGIYYFVSQDANSNYFLNSVKLSNGKMLYQIPFDVFDLDTYMYEMHYPNLLKEMVQHQDLYVCQGDSALLNLPGNYDKYEWNNGATTNSIYVSDASTYSAVLTKTDIGTTTTNDISLNIYDCSAIQDTVMYQFNTCNVTNAAIENVYTDNINIVNDMIQLDWNLVMQNGQVIKINAEYNFPHNGDYVIGCRISCTNRGENQDIVYYDVLGVSHLDNTLSVDEPAAMDFMAYPNPAGNYLNLKLNDVYKNVMVEIMSLNGQTIYNNHFTNTQDVSLDVSNYCTGFYLVKVNTEKETKMLKVVVSR